MDLMIRSNDFAKRIRRTKEIEKQVLMEIRRMYYPAFIVPYGSAFGKMCALKLSK